VAGMPDKVPYVEYSFSPLSYRKIDSAGKQAGNCVWFPACFLFHAAKRRSISTAIVL